LRQGDLLFILCGFKWEQLSLTYVERHRGLLLTEPNDGYGATFAFSIPHERQMI
jgi:hypothetical protein